jgi:hypothetical protein
MVSCGDSDTKGPVIFEKNFAEQNPAWQVSNDTIRQEIKMGFKDFHFPATITMLNAKDKDGCKRVAYLKIKNNDTKNTLSVKEITTKSIPCGSDWESEDTTRYETLIIEGHFTVRELMKTHKFGGAVGMLDGTGRYKPVQ